MQKCLPKYAKIDIIVVDFERSAAFYLGITEVMQRVMNVS